MATEDPQARIVHLIQEQLQLRTAYDVHMAAAQRAKAAAERIPAAIDDALDDLLATR